MVRLLPAVVAAQACPRPRIDTEPACRQDVNSVHRLTKSSACCVVGFVMLPVFKVDELHPWVVEAFAVY